MRYRLNSPDVVQEMIDGEVIVVHTVTGAYYSLADWGAAIWSDLLRGLDHRAIVERIAPEGDARRETVVAEIDLFIAELRTQRLIEPDESVSGAPPSEGPVSTDRNGPYVTPSIQKYSDMEELLLIDPIHEVDPAGWPVKPKGDV
jgi:hypothetical protein